MKMASQSIFSKNVIISATFLGGPIFTAILLSHNLKVMDEEIHNSRILLAGVVMQVLMIAVLCFIPEIYVTSGIVLLVPFIISLSTIWIIKKSQEKVLKVSEEYQRIKGADLAVVSLGAVTGLLVMFFLILSGIWRFQFYEKQILISEQATLFIDKRVENNVAEELAKVLREMPFMGADIKGEFILDDNDSHLSLLLVTNHVPAVLDSVTYQSLILTEDSINHSCSFKQYVNLGFTNEHLEVKKTVREVIVQNAIDYKDIHGLNSYLATGNHRILYDDVVDFEDVEVLAKAMKKLRSYFPGHAKIDVVLVSERHRYILKIFIVPSVWNQFLINKSSRQMISYIEDSGLSRSLGFTVINLETFEEKQIL